MSYLIPEELETKRLILRIFRLDDWEDIHEYYSDPECTKYTTRSPLKENESWQKMAALVGHWQLRNYGAYAMEEKNLKRVIGISGLDNRTIGQNLKFSGPWFGNFGVRAMPVKQRKQ